MDQKAFLNQTSVSKFNHCAFDDMVTNHTYVAFYSIFFVVGLTANGLSLFVAWVLMRRGNSQAVYLVFLSVSDLLNILFLLVWIGQALHWPINDALCSLTVAITCQGFYVGSGLLCCISVDRYLAVVYPLYFHRVREVRTALAVGTAVWGGEALVNILLLNHVGALQAFSSSRLCENAGPMTRAQAEVAVTRCCLGFLLPLAIMVFCFQQIMRSLRKSPSVQYDERSKICRLLLLLLLTYVVSFMPYQTVMLLRALLEPSGSCEWARSLRHPYMVVMAITTLNSILDPIIYCLINGSAKMEMKTALDRAMGAFRG